MADKLTIIAIPFAIMLIYMYYEYKEDTDNSGNKVVLRILALILFILECGIIFYKLRDNSLPMVQYTCKAYHTNGKTSIIKPIRRAIEDKTVKQLDDDFGDKTIYRCDILKADTIKK